MTKKELDKLLSVEESPQKLTREVTGNNDVSKTSVLRILKKDKNHPYKTELLK